MPTCPECNKQIGRTDRYCTECGTEVEPEVDPVQAGAEQQSSNKNFLQRHQYKILGLTLIQLFPLFYNAFVTTDSAGGAFGFLIGAGVAALVISTVLVALGVGIYRGVSYLITSARRSLATE